MRDEEEKTARFELRLPVSLRQKLQERAREHHRSLNSEIVDALGLAVEQNIPGRMQELEELTKRLSARYEEMVIDMQRVSEGLLPRLPPETADLIVKASQLAAFKGKTFSERLDETLRRMVNEEEPE